MMLWQRKPSLMKAKAQAAAQEILDSQVEVQSLPQNPGKGEGPYRLVWQQTPRGHRQQWVNLHDLKRRSRAVLRDVGLMAPRHVHRHVHPGMNTSENGRNADTAAAAAGDDSAKASTQPIVAKPLKPPHPPLEPRPTQIVTQAEAHERIRQTSHGGASEGGAATKIQAVRRGKAARADLDAKKAAPALKLARALADQERAGAGGSGALDKLRSVVCGRSRQVASLFISELKKDEGDDDSDDEMFGAGTAWLRQRDMQMAAELAQRLLNEELAR